MRHPRERPLKLAVTVSASSSAAVQARAAAEAWGLPYLERARNAAAPTGAEALLVLGGDGWTLWTPEGALRFTPGMAQLRIKRFAQGFDEDMLIRLGGLMMLEAGEPIDAKYLEEGKFEVEIANKRYPAIASMKPLFDPENKKIKA